ncbi:substrate-binding periplasmic protein [Zooshikella ganghwensis]|nr:transporter substrate-binding domain-containing protein [Zooshikella ganghwensis]
MLSTKADNTTILIATGEYPPWTSHKIKKNGFVNHVISEAFMRKGYKVYYIYLPWARSYTDTENGKYAALSYWACTEKVQPTFYCSDYMHKEAYVFFHEKTFPFPTWETLSDLTGLRIGATRSYTYTKEFWDAYESGSLNIVINNDDNINFNMLVQSRLDTIVVSTITGLMILNKRFPPKVIQNITFNSRPLVENTAHLLFPKKNKSSLDLLKIFNTGLTEIKQDGIYDKYMDDLIMGGY